MTATKIPTYIGKCVACKATYRWDVPAAVQITNPDLYPSAYHPSDPRADRPWCNCRTAAGHPVTAIKFKPLTAVTNPAVRCGAACENARSNKCICACGGTRHGRGAPS